MNRESGSETEYKMIEYYMSHPLYAVLVIALALAALFVLIKAIKAGNERAKRNRELMDKLHNENLLRNDFSILTPDLIKSSDPEMLFKGIGLNLQKRVSDKTDMISEFNTLTEGEKYIYCIYTFIEDAEEKMSNFFKMNTKPLTDTALEAINKVASEEFRDLFTFEFNAYDSDNEDVSCIPSEIEVADKKAAPFISDGTVCRLFGEYIKNNISDFIR